MIDRTPKQTFKRNRVIILFMLLVVLLVVLAWWVADQLIRHIDQHIPNL